MKKIIKGGMLGILILCILGLAFSMAQHRSTQSHHSHPTAKTSSPKRSKPLTITEFNHHPKLAFGSVIYFAIKHVNIQRWQEVSDFSLGWQVEIHRASKGNHYLVWPNKDIKETEKQLEPNWFEIKHQNQIVYHSLVVHSFGEVQTHTTTANTIIRRINADHAENKVRRMVINMTVIKDN